jgi:hypothetical protein
MDMLSECGDINNDSFISMRVRTPMSLKNVCSRGEMLKMILLGLN